MDLAPATHTGGVDQHIILLIPLHGNIHRVPGGAGHVIYHHPLFTQNAVGQGRLAHIGTAHNRQLDGGIFKRKGVFLDHLINDRHGVFQHGIIKFQLVFVVGHGIIFAIGISRQCFKLRCQSGFQQGQYTPAMRGGDLINLPQSQLIKLTGSRVRIDAVGLVGDQQGFLLTATQVSRNGFVGRGEAGTGIHHKQHHIGFIDGSQ